MTLPIFSCKPPCKRARTTNDRLGIFLRMHSCAHTHRALATCVLRQNQEETVA